MTDRLVAVAPDDPDHVRDRGSLYERLDHPAAACADYERYLAMRPLADDAPALRERLQSLSGRGARLN